MAQSSPDFELVTSLRYDPALIQYDWNSSPETSPSPLFLLPYHLDRFRDAAEHFEWPEAQKTVCGNRVQVLANLRQLCEETAQKEENGGGKKPLRIRLVLSPTGSLRAEAYPTASYPFDPLALSTCMPNSKPPEPILRVVLDTEPMPSSPFTAYKTTCRAHYNAARARAGVHSPLEEVILFDEEGFMTEGSVRNVAFWRKGRWVSPVRGGLRGVVRRWLVEGGRVVEGDVKREEVRRGEWVLLSNAVEGCRIGMVE